MTISPILCTIFAAPTPGFRSTYNQEKAKPAAKRGRKATGLIGASATDLIRESRVALDGNLAFLLEKERDNGENRIEHKDAVHFYLSRAIRFNYVILAGDGYAEKRRSG